MGFGNLVNDLRTYQLGEPATLFFFSHNLQVSPLGFWVWTDPVIWGLDRGLLPTPSLPARSCPHLPGTDGWAAGAAGPWCLQVPGGGNYLRVHNPALPSRSWVKSPTCHSSKGRRLEGGKRGVGQDTFQSCSCPWGTVTWGAEDSRKLLGLRLKVVTLRLHLTCWLFYLAWKAFEKSWNQCLKIKELHNKIQISDFSWIIKKCDQTDHPFLITTPSRSRVAAVPIIILFY